MQQEGLSPELVTKNTGILCEDLCTGLQEAIDFAKGVGPAKVTKVVLSD